MSDPKPPKPTGKPNGILKHLLGPEGKPATSFLHEVLTDLDNGALNVSSALVLIQGCWPSATKGPYRKGEHTTFDFLGPEGEVAAELKVVHEGDRLNVRVIANDVRLFVDGITFLPHGDNSASIKPRTRSEAGMPPHSDAERSGL